MKPATTTELLIELKLMWVGYVLKLDMLLPNIWVYTSLQSIKGGIDGGRGVEGVGDGCGFVGS